MGFGLNMGVIDIDDNSIGITEAKGFVLHFIIQIKYNSCFLGFATDAHSSNFRCLRSENRAKK